MKLETITVYIHNIFSEIPVNTENKKKIRSQKNLNSWSIKLETIANKIIYYDA